QARRRQFLEALGALDALDPPPDQRARVDDLRAREEPVHRQLMSAGPATADEALRASFGTLAREAAAIQDHARLSVAGGVQALQEAAERAKRLLLWHSVALVPAVFAVAALFIYLIVRPLRQLDRGIRRLGSGEFEEPIRIRGPRDLEDLGRRLDWMRNRILELENQRVLFLRQVSHELKTPLASIREGSELLREGVVGPMTREQTEVAELLHENGLHLQRLIEDLLSFSVSRTPAPAGERRPVRLDRIAQEVLDAHQLAVRSKRLIPITEVEHVDVTGDRDSLRTIMDNLVSNAVRHSPDSGRLWVRVKTDGQHAVVEVQDEGPGIPPDERDRIFDLFFRGRTQRQAHVEGTGLGLSIAREYARSHHGDIHVVDQERGARLRFTMPLQTQSRRTPAGPGHGPVSGPAGGV
ncbi:MAG: HAMP domain-containing sensor histidine kinase, partial [Chromatiales bacterium]